MEGSVKNHSSVGTGLASVGNSCRGLGGSMFGEAED